MALKSDSPLSIEAIATGITYLVGALGVFSVWSQVGLLYPVFFLALFLSSLFLEFRKTFFIPRWVLNMLSLSVLALSLVRLRSEDLVITTLEALIILIGIKFLEEKKFRDHMQIYLMTVLLLSGSSLLSSGLVFLVYLVCLVFLLTPAIVLLTCLSQDSALRLDAAIVTKIVAKSLLMPALAVPLTAFMFVVLPRTSYPLLHFLNKGDKAKTGFADNVALGRVSEIQEDPNIIFRAHMERVDGDSLYWRGVVFNHFDGKEWRASGDKIPDRPRLSAARGKRIIQTIYLEPYENRYLFAADKPAVVSMRNVVARTDLTFSLPENVGRRIQYEAVSVLSGTIPAGIPDRSVYLQLPEHLPEGMTDLVRQLSLHKNPPEIIRTLIAFFAKGDYTYSLKDLPVTTDPLGDFLFRYRYGNCEYFASALAVMLRVAGVPSRVVGGYRGGYYNAIGSYYAVPQKNAHVWVEAYLEGAGWIRLDPTPASADRFGADGRDIRLRMQLLFDSLNYYWNAAVIGYDFRKQTALFRKFPEALQGMARPKITWPFRKYGAVKSAAFFFLTAAGLAVIYYAFAFRRTSVEKRLLERFLRRMARHGYLRKQSEGLEEFVSKIADEDLQERASAFVKEFERHYYKDRLLSKETLSALVQTIRRL